MARIKKLKENGKTVYPTTIWNAVVDPTTGKTLKTLIGELNEALKKIDAISVKGYTPFTGSSGDPRGHIPVVKSDGVMSVGRYIDFHKPGSTADYEMRLMWDETDKSGFSLKFPRTSGYLAIGDETGTATYANSAMTADRLRTASNVAGDEDMPDTDSVQSFSGYVGKDKTNKFPILSVTTEFLDGTQQLSLQIGYSAEHGLMCRIGGRNTNGEFSFSDWQKILTQDI